MPEGNSITQRIAEVGKQVLATKEMVTDRVNMLGDKAQAFCEIVGGRVVETVKFEAENAKTHLVGKALEADARISDYKDRVVEAGQRGMEGMVDTSKNLVDRFGGSLRRLGDRIAVVTNVSNGRMKELNGDGNTKAELQRASLEVVPYEIQAFIQNVGSKVQEAGVIINGVQTVGWEAGAIVFDKAIPSVSKMMREISGDLLKTGQAAADKAYSCRERANELKNDARGLRSLILEVSRNVRTAESK